MFYKFPEIQSIDDVLPAIRDHKEFIVAEREGYKVINYMVQTPDTFGVPMTWEKLAKRPEGEPILSFTPNDLIRRECRGLIFSDSGELISRPYHKFFNLGEKMDTQIHHVDFSSPHKKLIKLDGSMIRPIYFKEQNGFRLGTKMGITDVAMKAEVFVSENLKYFNLFRACQEKNITPIFEWLSPNNRIVINYETDNLVVTAFRNTNTGEYFTFSDMVDFAHEFNVDCVAATLDDEEISKVLVSVKDMEDIEGIVYRFDNGHMLKVKTDLYCRMHKSKDIVSSDRRIYELILEEKIDDIKPLLMAEDISRVEKLENKLWKSVEAMANELDNSYDRFKSLDKKTFAISHANGLNDFVRRGIFAKMTNDSSSIELSRKFIAQNVGADNKFDAFRKKYALDL